MNFSPRQAISYINRTLSQKLNIVRLDGYATSKTHRYKLLNDLQFCIVNDRSNVQIHLEHMPSAPIIDVEEWPERLEHDYQWPSLVKTRLFGKKNVVVAKSEGGLSALLAWYALAGPNAQAKANVQEPKKVANIDQISAADPGASGTPFMSLEQLLNRLDAQRRIGDLGQNIAFKYEVNRLAGLGCLNPQEFIQKTFDTNIAAGYDLYSEFGGRRRYIEVKSSTVSTEVFFISQNELAVLAKLSEEAFVYVVSVDMANPSMSRVVSELQDPIRRLELEAVAYRATVM